MHNNNYLKNNLSRSLLIEVCLFPTNPEIPMLYFLTTQNLLLSQWMVRRLRRRSHWTAEFKVRGCDRVVNCQNSQWTAPGNTISLALVNKKLNKLNKQTNKPVKRVPKEENVRLCLQRGIGQLFIYWEQSLVFRLSSYKPESYWGYILITVSSNT